MFYTVYDTQDSADFESGLTLDEATREFWRRNGTVRDYCDARFIIVTDEDFAKLEDEALPVHAVRPVGWQY